MKDEWNPNGLDPATGAITVDTPEVQVEHDEPPLHYANLNEFVRDTVVTTWRRRVGPQAKYRWSAYWWRNTEAVMRLDAMWRSWEQARREPAGMAGWLHDVADPQMEILLDPEGPFRSAQDTNGPDEPLPYAPPGKDLFPDERHRYR